MANKIFLSRQTPLSFRTGGDVNFSIAGLAFGSGFRSARIDLGAGSTPYKFEWRAAFQINTTIEAADGSQSLDLYISTSDGTFADGGLSTTEGSVTTIEKRFNLTSIGNVVVDDPTGTIFYGSGKFECLSRYLSIVLFNFSETNLTNTQSSTINTLILTPLAEEVQ